MEGQTAQGNLAEKLISVIRGGGVVIIVGWNPHGLSPLNAALKASGKVRFAEEAPSSVSPSDYIIFTGAASDQAMVKAKRLTENHDKRRYGIDWLKQHLQTVAASVGVQLIPPSNGSGATSSTSPSTSSFKPPPLEANLRRPIPPQEPTQPRNEAIVTPSNPPSDPANQEPKDLGNELLELSEKMSGMAAEEKAIRTELAVLEEKRTELEGKLSKFDEARRLVDALKKL